MWYLSQQVSLCSLFLYFWGSILLWTCLCSSVIEHQASSNLPISMPCIITPLTYVYLKSRCITSIIKASVALRMILSWSKHLIRPCMWMELCHSLLASPRLTLSWADKMYTLHLMHLLSKIWKSTCWLADFHVDITLDYRPWLHSYQKGH